MKIYVIARTIALVGRVMVNPQVCLMDLTRSWHSGRCDAALIGGNNIVYVPRHDGLLAYMVNERIEEDSNTICDDDSNKTCHEYLNTTCDEDLKTTCEDSYTTCEED